MVILVLLCRGILVFKKVGLRIDVYLLVFCWISKIKLCGLSEWVFILVEIKVVKCFVLIFGVEKF